MSRLSRKNLVVDAEKVRELAQRRGTSESEAVRQAVDHALAAEEVMAAIRELRALHAFEHIDLKAWWPDDEFGDVGDEVIKKVTEKARLTEDDA